ncbi:MAG: hypothetical protein MN733_21630, partial [Nitrososphaera sp.]|nr:hypothetical protein [Nitrososphaera sp.]
SVSAPFSISHLTMEALCNALNQISIESDPIDAPKHGVQSQAMTPLGPGSLSPSNGIAHL